MANYPTQRNLALSPMDPSTWVAHYHPGKTVGPVYGRYTPWQTQSSTINILAEVAQDLIAADDAGIPFDAGQLWIRTRSIIANKATGGFDTTDFWSAVPSTLPAGYTAVPWRNNRGAGGCGADLVGAFQLDDGFGPPIFYFNWSPAKPIRLAAGPYTPLATTLNPFSGLRTYVYGPCNMRGAVGSIDFGVIGGGIGDQYISYHPGWRNIRIILSMSAASYGAAAPGSTATIGVGGTSHLIGLGDFVPIGGNYFATVDTGPVGLCAVGEVGRVHLTATAAGLSSADFVLYASPRVDIPAPFWSSYGNLVAPGGIAAGTVPGY